MRFLAFIAALMLIVAPTQAGNQIARSRICHNNCHVAAVKVYQPVQELVVYAPIIAPSSYYSVGEEYRLKNVVAAVIQELQTGHTVVQPPQAVTTPPAWNTTPLPQKVITPDCPTGHCDKSTGCNSCQNCGCGKATPTPTAPVPNPPAPAPTGPSQLDKEVLRIFNDTANGRKSCASCHGDSKAAGGLRLVVNGGINPALNKNIKATVALYTERGIMPPSVLEDPKNPKNEHLVSDADVKILTDWSLVK